MKLFLFLILFSFSSLISFAQKEPKQKPLPKENRQAQKPYIKKAEPKVKDLSEVKKHKKKNDMVVQQQPNMTKRNPVPTKKDPKRHNPTAKAKTPKTAD